jgi:hypothetical protein
MSCSKEQCCNASDDAVDIEDIIRKKEQDYMDPRHTSELRKWSIQCSCNECADACLKVPGMYDPNHLLKLLNNNEVSFKNIQKDYYIGEDIIWCLRPRTIDESHGVADFSYMKSPCVNLTPSGCRLPRKNMPLGCVLACNCDETKSITFDKMQALGVWDTQIGLDLIKMYDQDFLIRNPGACIDESFVNKQLQEIQDDPFIGLMTILNFKSY